MGGCCRGGASVCVNSACWFRTGSSDSTAPRPLGAAEDVSAPVRPMASGIPSGPSGTPSGTVRRRAPEGPYRPRPARGPGPVGDTPSGPVGPVGRVRGAVRRRPARAVGPRPAAPGGPAPRPARPGPASGPVGREISPTGGPRPAPRPAASAGLLGCPTLAISQEMRRRHGSYRGEHSKR